MRREFGYWPGSLGGFRWQPIHDRLKRASERYVVGCGMHEFIEVSSSHVKSSSSRDLEFRLDFYEFRGNRPVPDPSTSGRSSDI